MLLSTCLSVCPKLDDADNGARALLAANQVVVRSLTTTRALSIDVQQCPLSPPRCARLKHSDE